MRTVSCLSCGKTHQVSFGHFYGKICQCGCEIPPDGDIDVVKENKRKYRKMQQKALDSVVNRIKRIGDQ